jgi:hypothetical protein
VSRFFFNHVGIEQGAGAHALLNVTDGREEKCELLTTAGELPVAEPPLGAPEKTFRGQTVRRVDLSGIPDGRYALRYGDELSDPFHVGRELLLDHTLSSVLNYFHSQRCGSTWDEHDKATPFFGEREGTVDVRGGWHDASGDVSKYLSHLSYANFMNPQQTPIVLWGLLEHLERRQSSHAPGIAERLKDEARHGAEFLCRMQDPEGYFYMTVFDQWAKALDRRMIAAFKTQKGDLLEEYQAGMRQGGGSTIAALARAGRVLGEPRFIDVAKKGWAHLEERGLSYLDDGKENIIDNYCALLALAELSAATSDQAYQEKARARAAELIARIQTDGPHPGWLRADDGARPFFHAAEAGLPVVALLRAADVDPDSHQSYLKAAEQIVRFELSVTGETSNAYGYARQYTQDVHGKKQTAFFIPHENETHYWWQGENARLGSLAAAAGLVASRTQDSSFAAELRAYAFDQLDWICGRNPFDACMLHGYGRGNGNYMDKWPNVLGGICNGITSSVEDESDVDFGRTDIEGDHSWRWYEQWLPHASWYLIALAELHPDRS